MKLHKIAIILVLAIISLPHLTKAQTDEDFNPNYLISDEEMQAFDTMSREDIEAFLKDYKSTLVSFQTADKDGIVRPASEIIYRAAQEYKINPKYILVKLQKEQSLITNQNPTQKQYDGATGYGITDGCGWTCSSYLNNQGFGKQVDAAAGIIRWYYDNFSLQPWIKRPNQTNIIDGTLIIPENYATAFLYTYTPHLNGNKNFWKLWQTWFGQVIPDGTLIRSNENPTVYLIQDSKKRAIKSMSILNSRFDAKLIVRIPDSEVMNIPTGSPISLPNYSILKESNNYYLVDYDTLRPFASAEVVRKIGYNPDEILDVTSSDLEGYLRGSVINLDTTNVTGRVVELKENKSLYYLKENIYYPISDPQIIKVNFPNLTIEKVNASVLQNYTRGQSLVFKDGTLIGTKGSNRIYVIEKGKKRSIPSEEVFNAFGYNWNNIIWTDELTSDNHPTGQAVYLPERFVTPNPIPDVTDIVTESGISSSTGKMISVTEGDTKYVGDKFVTPVNTFLIADYDSQKVLAGKNIDVVRPLASFTKVLTAYRLMVEGLSLNKSVTFANSQKAVYHNFRVTPGEKILNENLLESLLVSSINTPARMLVSSVTKDEAGFIKRMNKQVLDWGLTHTKFTDTYGYDLGNVTTAREYLTLFTNSEKNNEVRRFLGMKNYSYTELIDKDSKPQHFDENSNALMNKTNLPFSIISSKTGYLDESGAGLVMLIERPSDKKRFIVITMGNPDYANRFDEPEKLAEWAVSSF